MHVVLHTTTHPLPPTRVYMPPQARLVGIYETSSPSGLAQLSLRYTLPQRLVRHVGAPQALWTIIRCRGGVVIESEIIMCERESGSATSADKTHV